MNKQLEQILARINDPVAIRKVLEITQGSDQSKGQRLEKPNQESLVTLYERFLSRRQDRSPSTRAQYKRTILDFIEFSESNEVAEPSELSIHLLDSYVDSLQERYNSDATILTYTKNVRGWLRWLTKRGYCDESLYRILDKDDLGLSPKARDEALSTREAELILEQLRNQRRGTLKHALIELLWNAGLRIGGARSLDIRDFVPEENEIRLRHRPTTGTRLKNGSETKDHVGNGERNVALKECVVNAIEIYIELERPDVTDEFGRSPLFATSQGRAARSTLRRKVYEATSCRWNTSPDSSVNCDGECSARSEVCPVSFYPHAIRRGAIVHHLSSGLRPDIASERFDVSVQTLRRHYDPRTEQKRKQDRSEYVRNCW
ncbi:tyrosine-type recombinase/integrase [Haloferax sp. MBLA0076]|uniref:Tyrosine-type recombinase/integrase n=1 Tax=Haloferax litoreum TaxID=2666140 RepID=A0A6A8GFF2_9EURY|nr:tyrosine-type recombinase/integrase [Haloferax sp. CBA1148]MRX20887.1 tyrosine-type recombinase/integrase [Haloferax litoreum]